MGWTDPDLGDFAVDEEITAAKMDTYVKDNLSWLGIDRPHCRVQDASRSHVTGSSGDWIGVEFDSATTNVGPSSMWTDGVSYVSIPAAGFWLISGYAQWTTNDATGVRGVALSSGAVSSATPSGTIFVMNTAPGSAAIRSKVSVSCSTLVYLAANTQVYCSIFQSSGIALTVAPVVLSAIWMTS